MPTKAELDAKLRELDRLRREANRLTGGTTADRNRAGAAERSRAKSASSREIGKLPPIVDPDRREACATDLGRFARDYFPATFTLPFSPDHETVITKMELAITQGGLFALAMPRGSGKTSLTEIAAIWATLYGYHPYTLLIGSDVAAAMQMLDSIKSELEGNAILAGDFPEVCYPVQALEGEPRRCKGQTYLGERTQPRWSDRCIVLPTIPDAPASGAIIQTAGITAHIRGRKFKRPDGSSVRPGLVLIDDPQTDESAHSLTQCESRERTLSGAILGLAGPGKKIAGLMPCTVICEGDLADRMLNSELHPEWNASRFQLIYSFPTNTELWDRYKETLNTYDATRPGDRERAAQLANLFYLEHSTEMDEGAVVAWPERFAPDELSATQHCMNLLFRDEFAFWSEFQNKPKRKQLGDIVELTPEQIASKVNRLARRLVPVTATHLVAFIDVQKDLLYYLVAAFDDDFTGSIIDYGSYPDQKKPYFSARDARPTLERVTKAAGLEAQLYTGLTSLTAELLTTDWPQDTASPGMRYSDSRGLVERGLRIERLLIDANWGQSTDVVYQFARQSPYSPVLTPSHGKFVGASSSPLTDRKRKPGERHGLNWIQPLTAKRSVRHTVFDSNFWKSFLHARLAMAPGSRGDLAIFGDSPDLHRMLADHLSSEYRVRVEGRGRQVDEWKLTVGRENHWLDCAVGCCVAASMQGVSLAEVHAGTAETPKRKVISFTQQRAEAQKKRK